MTNNFIKDNTGWRTRRSNLRSHGRLPEADVLRINEAQTKKFMTSTKPTGHQQHRRTDVLFHVVMNQVTADAEFPPL